MCDLICWIQSLALIALCMFVYAKFLRYHVSGYMLKGFVEKLTPFLKPGKQKLFDDAFGTLNRSANSSFNVLEIGVGTGANFQFYPKNCRITILDKTAAFLPHLKQTLLNIERSDLIINELVVNPAENMTDVKSNSIDAVVSTFTLCSVEYPVQVFSEVKRVLKPGGVFLFMDHSKDMSNSVMAYLHTFMGPAWTFFFGDCRFRDIKTLVNKHSALNNLTIKEYRRYDGGGILAIINPLYHGYGCK